MCLGAACTVGTSKFYFCSSSLQLFSEIVVWGSIEYALETYWGHIGDALGMHWERMHWGRIGDALGMHWGRIRDALETLRGQFGDANVQI